MQVGNVAVDFLESLPLSFKRALDVLADVASPERCAVLLQIFVWGWGGFLLEDKLDEEYQLLATQSGLEVKDVERSLAAFVELFPQVEWFTTLRNSRLRILKLVPAQFRGLGAFQRLRRYKLKAFEDFGYTDDTALLLNLWYRNLYEFLS